MQTTLKEIHFDHCEDNAEGAENRLDRRDTAEFLRKIRRLDGHVERGKDKVSPFLSLDVGSHGFKVDVVGGNAVASRLCGKI
jgi:hypothetical protein